MLAGRPLKILIVDDDRVDRELYKLCLRGAQSVEFEFADCDSATAGIQLATSATPDCMLLDYDLPDMNGLEALDRLTRQCDGLPCAVVMSTAFGGEGLAVQAMKAGVMDYLPKRQVDSETLTHTVTNAIDKFQMQRRIEEHRVALARSERRYGLLLEAMPQMVWTTNAEGRAEYANRIWLEYTGLSLDKAGPLGWDELLHPEDRERTWSGWKAATESGTPFEIEHRLRRAADQKHRWHLVRAVPMKDGAGKVTNWLGTSTEVENQKQAEQANLDREKLEGLGRLAGGIAHDFNNLLVTILGGASLVADTLCAGDPSERQLRDVVRAGERAAELTRKMLAYSGKGNLYVEALDLAQIASRTCESMRPSLPDRISLVFQGSWSLPPVETDAKQLRQVIVDLIMNAVEAIGETAPGTIWVRSKGEENAVQSGWGQTPAASLPAGSKYVVLEVQDTGCGMDTRTQARIFDPFFTTKFTGRGLSLAAVQGFVRSNGGSIRVQSMPGRGTTLQVLLPAAVDCCKLRANGS